MIPRYGNASKYTFLILYWYVDRGLWLSGFWRIALCSDLCIMFVLTTLIKSDKTRLCCATWSYGLLIKCSNIYQISWPAEPAGCQIYHIYIYVYPILRRGTVSLGSKFETFGRARKDLPRDGKGTWKGTAPHLVHFTLERTPNVHFSPQINLMKYLQAVTSFQVFIQ